MTRFVVLFAMPVSYAAFSAAAREDPLSDYMRLILASGNPEDVWERRYSAIVDAAQALVHSLRSWQVPMVECATLSDLQWATQVADVVVLFAHWRAKDHGSGYGCLEFADGAHTPEHIEAALAPNFAGTLDLCNCTSVHIASLIKKRRGDAVWTIFNENLLDPLPAYVIVRQLMEYCLKSGMDYRLARLNVAAELRRDK